MNESNKLKAYYFTAVLSLLFAVIGFSYNAWRLEVSESNSNIRTAAFEVLKELALLERIVFAAYYDQDRVKGNPREGWVKIGLISDLSVLVGQDVEQKSVALKQYWSSHWQKLAADEKVAKEMVARIDKVRVAIKRELVDLR